jgi:hypothetical protein
VASRDNRSESEKEPAADGDGAEAIPRDGEALRDDYFEDDDDDDDAVPRLPRGRGINFFGGDFIRIAMFLTLLVAVLRLREPCARGVANFMDSFEVDAGAPPTRRLPEGRLIRITGDETDEELRRKLGRFEDGGIVSDEPVVPMPADAGVAKPPSQ